jgi:hypothetical protein
MQKEMERIGEEGLFTLFAGSVIEFSMSPSMRLEWG